VFTRLEPTRITSDRDVSSPARTIIAIDATNMWHALGELSEEEYELPQTHLELLQLQCEPHTRRRDLIKAYPAFDASRREEAPHSDGSTSASTLLHRRVLWTGSWGCNSFDGNVRVKFVLQWMAATLAHVHLIRYQVFTVASDDAFTRDVAELVDCVRRHPVRATIALISRCLDESSAIITRMTIASGSRAEFDTPRTARTLFDLIRSALEVDTSDAQPSERADVPHQ
jgi:hypothetical protein